MPRGVSLRSENMKLEPRMESPKIVPDDDILPEYDFSGAVRGKYYERYR